MKQIVFVCNRNET